MNEAIVIQWLQRNWPIWVAFILAFMPPLIAELKGRPRTRWYFYGLACALVAWPLVTLPTTLVLLLRRRNGLSEQISRQRRRADALALLAEDSVRSYPSWKSLASSGGYSTRVHLQNDSENDEPPNQLKKRGNRR